MVVVAKPLALFDPQLEAPPADAVDIQLRMPRSMQLWVDDLHRQGRRHELADIQSVFEEIVHGLVKKTQQSCGYVRAPGRSQDDEGLSYEAQIAITPVVEGEVPGVPGLRPHGHLYVGGTGWRLRDGVPAPIHWRRLGIGATNLVWGTFARAVTSAAEEFGLSWGWSSPSGSREIVDPPYAERGEAAGYAECPGRWGPRRLVFADASAIAGGLASEERRVKQAAAGVVWRPQYADGRPVEPDDPYWF